MIAPFQSDTHTQRRLLGGLLAGMLAAALVVAWYGSHLYRNNQVLQQQITLADEATQPYLDSDQAIPLPSLLAAEQRVHGELQAEWDALVARVDTFDAGMDLFSGQSGESEEGRIDFKVALFNARTNLLEQARLQGRTVPEDLGMRETIDADEPAETLLWQLATVVGFMERAIEFGIPQIERIKPQPPTVHVNAEEAVPFAREFPLHISLQCSFSELYQLIDALLQKGSYFALRRFDLEKPSPDPAENLMVHLVYAGEVFDVLTLIEEAAPTEPEDPPPAADLSSTNDWGETW